MKGMRRRVPTTQLTSSISYILRKVEESSTVVSMSSVICNRYALSESTHHSGQRRDFIMLRKHDKCVLKTHSVFLTLKGLNLELGLVIDVLY